MARGPQLPELLGSFALTESGDCIITKEWPLGEAYHAILIHFRGTYTVSTLQSSGLTNKSNPFYHLMRGVKLETDYHGTLVDLPAKALKLIAQVKHGPEPYLSETINTTAAAAYPFEVCIPIYFEDFRMQNPTDLLLDTEKVSKMTLTLSLRADSDLYSGTVSTLVDALSSMYADVYTIRSKGALAQEAKPGAFLRQTLSNPPFSAAAQTYIDLARNPNEAIKRLYCFTGNGASGTLAVATEAMSGSGNNLVHSEHKVESNLATHVRNVKPAQVRAENQMRYQFASIPAGLHVYDFVRDGSHYAALPTGDKSVLQFKATNESSLPSGTNVVTCFEERLVRLAQ